MSKKNVPLTTALVASIALGFPQSSLAQDVSTDGIEMVCLDGTEPPCPENEPVEGTPVPSGDAVPAQTPELSETPLPTDEPDATELPDPGPDATGDVPVDPAISGTDADSGTPPEVMVDPEADVSPGSEDLTTSPDLETGEPVLPQPEQIEPDLPEIDLPETDLPPADLTEPAAEGSIDAPATSDETVMPATPTDPAIDPATTDATDAETGVTVDPADSNADDAIAPETDPMEVSPVGNADVEEPVAADVTAAAAAAAGTDAAPSDVTEEIIGADETRSSDEEFETQIDGSAVATGDENANAPEVGDGDNGDSGGLSRLEQVLLLGLGAVAVGSLLDDGSEVVSNSGDRVVVQRDGQYVVYKDDDALLFQEGMTVRTENFADGSTRSFLTREDGSQIVTIRDAEGRVLRRTQIAADGTEIQLFDDTVQAQAIDTSRLATYRPVEGIAFSTADQAALRAALLAETEADRRFSLRQIREYQEVRSLVPSIDLDTINFATGAASIAPAEIQSLIGVGNTMAEILSANPREVFLIEGHTDAVGDAATNLALSDRRAETVALALTEYFAIPPENLVVQGYGEQFLKVDTERAAQENRRATVRRITTLLQITAAN